MSADISIHGVDVARGVVASGPGGLVERLGREQRSLIAFAAVHEGVATNRRAARLPE